MVHQFISPQSKISKCMSKSKEAKQDKKEAAYYKPQHYPVLHRTKNTQSETRASADANLSTLFSQGNTKVLSNVSRGENRKCDMI